MICPGCLGYGWNSGRHGEREQCEACVGSGKIPEPIIASASVADAIKAVGLPKGSLRIANRIRIEG